MTYLSAKDFFLEVAKGNVGGHTALLLFAHNSAVGTTEEDMWPQGGTLTYLTSAETMNIVSTSTADDDGSTGARTVLVSGVDGNLDEASETVTMDGTTNVLTSNTYLRINKMAVVTAGSGETNAGIITATASTAATVQSHIEAGVSISRCGHYTVPNGYTAYIIQSEISSHKIGGGGGTNPEVRFNGYSRTTTGPWVQFFDEVIDTVTIERVGIMNRLPTSAAGGTDLKIAATSDLANTEVDGRFWMLVVAN